MRGLFFIGLSDTQLFCEAKFVSVLFDLAK